MSVVAKNLKRGQSIKPCAVCERNYRPTQGQPVGNPGQPGCCDECWDLAGYQNELADYGELEDPAYVRNTYDALLQKPGVNVNEVRKEFSGLLTAVGR